MRSLAHQHPGSHAFARVMRGLVSLVSLVGSVGSVGQVGQVSLTSLTSLPGVQAALVLAPVSLGVATMSGCTRRYAAYPAGAKDTTERMVQAHAAIAQLRTSPFAMEATLDINRAESLLLAAEKRASDPETVDEFLDLLLTTVEGQLVQVNTYYARRKAETTLDARRAATGDRAVPSDDRADVRPMQGPR